MKKRMVIVLVLLIGIMLAGGILHIWYFHSANVSEGAAPLSDLGLVKMVSYSCSGGSVAEQSFLYSLQEEDEKALFSCDYFRNDHESGGYEKVIVKDVELPAESFTTLIQLMANVHFPDEHKKADDGIIVLDAATYSLTVYYVSGKRRSLDSHTGINKIKEFFHEINDA